MKRRERLRLKLLQGVWKVLAGAERLRHGAMLDVMGESFPRDPHTALAEVRDRGPVFYSLALRGWWVTSFDLVREVLRDARFSADVRRFEKRAARMRRQIGDDAERLESFENPSMLNLDPPDHTRIRRLATHAFTQKYILSLEPRIDAIVTRCLDRVGNEASFDVMDVLAKPLPAIVIAEMMGLPEADHGRFQAWSEDLIAGSGTNEPAVIERAQRSSRALLDYFAGIVAGRRANANGEVPESEPDLLDQLMAAEEAGDKLNARELYNTCLLLLVAGHETTTRLIGNGLYWLLSRADQLEALRADPDRLAGAVEEMLRFEPPVLATMRYALEDLELGGRQLHRGDAVFVSIAAANRDPAANERPGEFDITRDKVNQVGFGYGIHLCIGASLARLEARVALARVLERFPDLGLAREPEWAPNPFFRGFDHLLVDTGAGASRLAASS